MYISTPTALHLTEVPELPSKLLSMNWIKFMKFLNIIDDRFDELLNRLEMLSNINTHTYNLLGLDSCIYPLEKMFEELEPDESQQIEIGAVPFVDSDGELKDQHYGRILRLRKRQNAETKILLCGHYDTVYPKDHDFQKVTIDGNKMMVLVCLI